MEASGLLLAPAALSLAKNPKVPIRQEAREGPRPDLDTVVKRKKNPLPPLQGIEPRLSSP